MRRTLSALVLATVLGCGGSNNNGSNGGGNTSDPVAACKSLFTTLCNKLFQCNPSGAAQAYGSSSACVTALSGNCNAAGTACPSGTSYNASNAAACINDYSNESCTDVTNNVSPASCNKICQ
ncbi:MAG TPA: hypothetical protein VMH40_18960 [Myxococcaceae bacterium]|nr:hypothetical protein [Myxococcaceae bacterium]